jgi:hypothetical protein
VIKLNGDVLREQMHYADKTFFSFFNFPLKDGSYDQSDKNSVIISEALALKYFDNASAVGKQLNLVSDNGTETF